MTDRFVHTRRLTFGDTDAARIVYTARVAYFVVEAVEAWFLERLDVSWLHINRDHGIGTPFVRLEVDFVSMMTPPDLLATEVALEKAGRSSLGFRLIGRIGARLCWNNRSVCAFVASATGRSVAIPEHLRGAIARELALGTAD